MKRKFNAFLFTVCIFAFTLIVTDAVFATLKVNVMPSGTTSQANIWDSKGPYTWPNNSIEIWGNVEYDGSNTLTYTWNLGAGQGIQTGTVTNVKNIAVTHAYPETNSYKATLTVTDGTETDSDSVFIDVVPQTLDVQVNLAIQKGLKNLYNRRMFTTVNGVSAVYYGGSYYYANTAMATLALQNHGHLEQNDQARDIYAKTVEDGLNYLFSRMNYTSAATTPPTDSDINGNLRKVWGESSDMYANGMVTMAIAGSLNPTGIVGPEGSTAVRGYTYQEVLEDMVDYLAYAQQDSGSYTGGWRYSPNGGADNSVGQWPLLGLAEAEKAPWNIHAPQWVKTQLISWINYDQVNSPGAWYHGAFGYTSATYYPNIAKTGAGIAMMAYAGGGGSISNAVAYINNDWDVNENGYLYRYHMGNTSYPMFHYAMYGVKKGMEYANLSLIGAHDWQEEYNAWYVAKQNADGSWPNGYWISNTSNSYYPMPTSFGLLILAPLEACKPIADAGNDQDVSENAVVTFDGTDSYHTCPDSGSIVSYVWDFNYDGITVDTDATGPVVSKVDGFQITNGTDTQNFTVALQVTDGEGRISTDTLIVTVSNGNVAPVAVPGGPYLGAVGADITLDGSGSHDDNSINGINPIEASTTSGYDEIVSYKWDTDADGLYGDEDSPADPQGPNPVVRYSSFGTKTIGLKVTDSFGKTAAQSSEITTVAISNIQPVSYELISNRYNRRTGLWTAVWKMTITNVGDAPATNITAQITGSSVPEDVTILSDSLSWTIPDSEIASGELAISDQTFSYTYPRGIDTPDLTQMTWDFELTDALGITHIVRSVPQ